MVFRVTRSHGNGFEDERLRHDLDSHQGCERATMSRSLFVLVTLMTSMHLPLRCFSGSSPVLALQRKPRVDKQRVVVSRVDSVSIEFVVVRVLNP
jgi:hypothetical protein